MFTFHINALITLSHASITHQNLNIKCKSPADLIVPLFITTVITITKLMAFPFLFCLEDLLKTDTGTY